MAGFAPGISLGHDPEKWIPVFPRDKREAFARRSCSNKTTGGPNEETDQRRRECDERKPCRILCGAFRYRAHGRACTVRAAPASQARQGGADFGWRLRARTASYRLR